MRIGLHPDAVTVAGLVIVFVAAVIAAQGNFALSGVILIIGMPLDALDGAIARAMNRTGRFGAFLDSTLDRYADGLMFGGLAYYFASRGDLNTMLIAIAALIGAFAVSYARARAEGLGIGSIKDGLFDRLVRVIVLIAALVTGWVIPGLIVLAIGSHFTAIQRIWIVYQAAKEDR